jgi:hypothetical protein
MRLSSPLPLMASLCAGAAATATYGMFASSVVTARSSFALLTGILVAYLLAQIAIIRRVHPRRWLINPAVLGSFVTFLMGYGLTNVIFLMPPSPQELWGVPVEITSAMVKVMALAVVAAIAMWLGYWSPLASYLANPAVAAKFQSILLPRSSASRAVAVPVLIVVSTGARLIQVRLGVFGYSSTVDRLVELGSFTQYLFMAAGLGKLALVIVALQGARGRGGLFSSGMLCLVGGLEVAWGFLSGFKSAVVMPFVIVGICRYLALGRVPFRWIGGALIGLVMAYAVIEPFRDERNRDTTFAGTDLTQIVDVLVRSVNGERTQSSDSAPTILRVASRWNLAYMGSRGVAYADTGSLTLEDPTFLKNLVLTPLYAYVPRAVWEGKPRGTLGLWYHQVVIGGTTDSSDAMGPVTYLYFAAGGFAVFMGFALVGVVQRASLFLLQPWRSLPGAVTFLALLGPITSIDSAFDAFLIRLFREVPLLLMLQFLLFSSTSDAKRHSHPNPAPSTSISRDRADRESTA